jgi:hypothetical protein
MPSYTGLILALSMAAACSHPTLQGSTYTSPDAQTYLVIDEQDRQVCNTIYVDGRRWPYRLHEAGSISPGVHQISCGTGEKVEIRIRPGTTFHFRNWTP